MRSENKPRLLLARVGDVFSTRGDNISIISVVSRPAFDANASHIFGHVDLRRNAQGRMHRKYR